MVAALIVQFIYEELEVLEMQGSVVIHACIESKEIKHIVDTFNDVQCRPLVAAYWGN